jgi:hypothetical protein
MQSRGKIMEIRNTIRDYLCDDEINDSLGAMNVEVMLPCCILPVPDGQDWCAIKPSSLSQRTNLFLERMLEIVS